MHWPRIVFYVVTTMIWHGWLRRDNSEINGYPFQSVLVANIEAHKPDFIPSNCEPEMTMSDL